MKISQTVSITEDVTLITLSDSPADIHFISSIFDLSLIQDVYKRQVGIPGAFCAGEQQDKIIVPIIEELKPPHHIRAIHIPTFDKLNIG